MNVSESGTQQNTRITYLYRDADNYKVHNEVVVSGILTYEQQAEILSCLNEGEYFIPEQVGLPEERFGSWTEADHCWFELGRYDFTATNRKPTIFLTAQELLENFRKVKNNWRDSEMPCM